MKKPAFPQTPDGVTDWEKVFEDPNDGLITVIARAPNADVLRDCMLALIRQLYTRKNDELEIARLEGEVEHMFATAGGALPTDEAIELLRKIKDQRIRKALDYLANKKGGSGDRRSKAPDKGLKRVIYLLFNNPKYLIGATVATAAVAGYLLLALNDLSTDPADTAEAPIQPPPPDGVVIIPPAGPPGTAAPPPPAKTGPMAGVAANMPTARRAYRSDDEDKPPTTIIFQHLNIPRPFVPERDAAATVVPVAVLTEDATIKKVCKKAPVIYHLVNIALSDAANAGSKFDAYDLDRMAETLQRKINAQFKEPMIEMVKLIRDADNRVFARHNCAQAPSAVVRRLNLGR
jgi:hypothetical protein